jgi:hypothetical protein
MKKFLENKIGFLPIMIICLFLLRLLLIVYSTEILLDREHWFAISGISVCILLYFIKIKYGSTFLLLLLVLGMFNVIAFTPTISSYIIGFSIGSFSLDIRVQLFSLVMLSFFILTNRKPLKFYFKNYCRDGKKCLNFFQINGLIIRKSIYSIRRTKIR